ncbi:trypsin-1-like [Aphidius gifuensis]|uniref:trypsin-1-like n=1 Tax=Aphidius gifuensis TaxID=684658 RepID=UPI001CDCE031|nr:trypsin-1-like [Aphidius gifuensis]
MKWMIYMVYVFYIKLIVITQYSSHCHVLDNFKQLLSEDKLNITSTDDVNLIELENATEILIDSNELEKRINIYGNSSILEVPTGKKWIWLPNFVWAFIGLTTTTTTTTTISPPTTTEDQPEESSECQVCECGISNPPNRIVNGFEVRVLQYPWVVYLTYQGRYSCAASIISDKYVLTASHCIDRYDKTLLKVVVGDHDRNSSTDTNPIEYKVEEIIKHSGYTITNYDNDIALIKIDGRIKYNGTIRPVCLPDTGPTYAGENGTVVGWGSTKEGGSSSNVLRQVVVPIMTNGECRAMKYPPRRITSNMMCAGFPGGGQDSCQGDSGGPLTVIEDKIYKIVGVVSWGEGCASPGYPGVYARVNRYMTWIEQNTADSCYC